jgi:hypothetical protein
MTGHDVCRFPATLPATPAVHLQKDPPKSLCWRILRISPTRSRFCPDRFAQPLCFDDFTKAGGGGTYPFVATHPPGQFVRKTRSLSRQRDLLMTKTSCRLLVVSGQLSVRKAPLKLRLNGAIRLIDFLVYVRWLSGPRAEVVCLISRLSSQERRAFSEPLSS